MADHQLPDPCFPRNIGSLGGRAVEGDLRPVFQLAGKGAFVVQQVAVLYVLHQAGVINGVRTVSQPAGRFRISGILAVQVSFTAELIGDIQALLQHLEIGQREVGRQFFRQYLSGCRLFSDQEAGAGDPVPQREGPDADLFAGENLFSLIGVSTAEIQGIIQESLAVAQLHAQYFIQSLGPHQDERLGPAGIVQCIDQCDQPIVVVAVEMGDEYVFQPGETNLILQHLELGSLAAVDQDTLIPEIEQGSGWSPFNDRSGGTGT